ncbi:MAG: hypothetical protein MJ041_06150, partial [Acidaminococcaceae bacterium]|nr:hypothetical protein [Acidaminococcaceae bacterium]
AVSRWFVPPLAVLILLAVLDHCFLFHTIVKLPNAKYQCGEIPHMGYGGFRLWVGKEQCATTGVAYILPVDDNGKPCPKGIVIYGPYLGENIADIGRLPSWLNNLAAKYGYLVFSIAPHNKRGDIQGPDYYGNENSGWDKIFFRVAEHLRRQFNIPKGQMKMIGQSGGGSMVQRLHAKHPALFSSVAWANGANFKLYEHTGTGKILGISNWSDGGAPDTEEIINQAISNGYDATFLACPPMFYPDKGVTDRHTAWDMSFNLLVDFTGENPDWMRHLAFQPPKHFSPCSANPRRPALDILHQ